jgi:hypothetical protein
MSTTGSDGVASRAAQELDPVHAGHPEVGHEHVEV